MKTMMNNARTIFRRCAPLVLGAALSFVHQTAQACEGCKQAVGMGDGANGSRVVNNIGLGYGISIVMLLLMVAGLLTGLGYMMYRNCQIIAAQQRAAFEAEEGGGDFGGSLPMDSRA